MSVSAPRTIAAAAVLAVATGAAIGVASTTDSSPGGEPGTSTRSTSGPGSTPPSGDAHAAGTPETAPASGSGTSSGGRSGGQARETAPDSTAPASPRPREHDALLASAPDETTTATDELVSDYPDLLGPAPHSRVVSSSMSPSGSRVQVALVARHPGAREAVLRYYRTNLARSGFAERRVEAAGGASAAAFERRDGTVVVTVQPGRSGTYSLYATLLVG
jgi:hypothetical protein